METINKHNFWIYKLGIFLIIATLFILLIILNLKLTQSYDVIIKTDESNKFKIISNNSNLNFVSNSRDLYLKIEDKEFFIQNVELKNIGFNEYLILFDNNEIQEHVFPNSIFHAKLITGSKKIFNILFKV